MGNYIKVSASPSYERKTIKVSFEDLGVSEKVFKSLDEARQLAIVQVHVNKMSCDLYWFAGDFTIREEVQHG